MKCNLRCSIAIIALCGIAQQSYSLTVQLFDSGYSYTALAVTTNKVTIGYQGESEAGVIALSESGTATNVLLSNSSTTQPSLVALARGGGFALISTNDSDQQPHFEVVDLDQPTAPRFSLLGSNINPSQLVFGEWLIAKRNGDVVQLSKTNGPVVIGSTADPSEKSTASIWAAGYNPNGPIVIRPAGGAENNDIGGQGQVAEPVSVPLLDALTTVECRLLRTLAATDPEHYPPSSIPEICALDQTSAGSHTIAITDGSTLGSSVALNLKFSSTLTRAVAGGSGLFNRLSDLKFIDSDPAVSSEVLAGDTSLLTLVGSKDSRPMAWNVRSGSWKAQPLTIEGASTAFPFGAATKISRRLTFGYLGLQWFVADVYTGKGFLLDEWLERHGVSIATPIFQVVDAISAGATLHLLISTSAGTYYIAMPYPVEELPPHITTELVASQNLFRGTLFYEEGRTFLLDHGPTPSGPWTSSGVTINPEITLSRVSFTSPISPTLGDPNVPRMRFYRIRGF